MLAKELLLVLGFVITGAVSLPITQGTTESAPTLLNRDLSNDIHAAVLQARVPGGKTGKPVPPNKWANPMLPQVVEKKPAPSIPDMDKLWSGRSSKPAPKPGTTKPPKVPVKPKDKKSRRKRDDDEEAEEAAEYDQ